MFVGCESMIALKKLLNPQNNANLEIKFELVKTSKAARPNQIHREILC